MKSLENVQVGVNGVSLLSPLTGIGQYTFHLVSEMQKMLRVKPWLFYGAGWGQEVRTVPFSGISEIKSAIKRFVPRPYAVSRFAQQCCFSAGALRHRITLYHEPNFLAYRFRGPTVVNVHDLSWIRHPDAHPKERVAIMNRMMPQVVKRADHILADSEFVRQEIIEYYGVTPERVTTVLLGVSSDFYPVREDACKVVLARHELRYGDYLLAVGTLEPRKNLSTVIAAFAQLPETTRRRFPLIIVGMKGWGMEEFSAATRQMFDRGEVRMLGYVPQADLPTLYAGARLFVYPSIYEGFGLPPLEAMACGTPVIVSNRASLPEVVGNAGILVDPMDDAIIAQQMSAVLENDGLYQKLSEAGVKQAKSFTWRNCATGTMAVYQKVLECH